MNRFRTLYVILLLLLVPEFMSAQCAMCRAALESGGGEELARGVNNGIMYLMAVPYVLLAVIGFFIFKRMK
ncbi:hypothetical protein [Galbibacter sp.]|jgi:hypothetical protein|uniref:hypothetical protein n=1 Tax=Galbibacter sp. TaxID=2918471 RepID=UPI003A8F0445